MRETITQEAAARELLRRRRARSSLVEYSKAIEIPGAPISDDPDSWLFKPIGQEVAKHHVVTMEAIERCVKTEYGRLIIMEPPGSAKSTYASVVGTTYAMAKIPGLRVLMVSYAATPIIRHSKRARAIVRSKLYQSIWPDGSMSPTSKPPLKPELYEKQGASDEWELTNGSGMFACGLLGGITSTRADLLVIDDPVAGREEADSENNRRKIRQAYDDDAMTRLKPGASVILIQTRWHGDDLAGSILPEDYEGQSGTVLCRDGQEWEVLNIQAQCERHDDPLGRKIGEYMWPEWFKDRHWKIFKAVARTWDALFQQRPSSDTGGQFSTTDFKRYSQTPGGLSWYLSSDYAVTEESIGENPDYTEHGAFGINSEGDIYADGGWSGQEDPEVTVKEFIKLVKDYKPNEALIEAGVIFNAMKSAIKRAMDEAKRWTTIEKMPSMGDKVAKVAAFRARAKAGKVYVKEGPWGDALIKQLVDFPFTRFDDKVDICGQIGRRVDDMFGYPVEKKKKKKQQTGYTLDAIEQMDRRDEQDAIKRERYLT